MQSLNHTCPTCGSVMTFIQRRGSSSGVWLCPICSSSRKVNVPRPDDDEPDFDGNSDRRAA
jgi:ribosomal protein L37AE/L43A